MKRLLLQPLLTVSLLLIVLIFFQGCKPKGAQASATGDASKSYVAPGKYDEFYNIVSG